MTYHYVWLIWSSAFLLPWFCCTRYSRSIGSPLWWASVFMAPFGLTEPIFVPEYWNPPSLFELAQRTGFDIESIIFSFAIGGIAAVLYNIILLKRMEVLSPHGAPSMAASLAPMGACSAVRLVSLVFGAIATVLCRPDLKSNTLLRRLIPRALFDFLLGLKWSAPGYIERVWNLKAISGIVIYGLPIEELMFRFSFGLVWTGIYEHFTWKRSVTG